MDSDQLIHPEDLWWPMVVLAARHVVRGDGGGSLDVDDSRVCLVGLDNYVQLQRFRGGRAVLWGRIGESENAPVDEVPDWARTEPVLRSMEADGVNFIAWYAHGEWDAATSAARGAPTQLLARMPQLDPEVLDAVRRNDLESPALRDFLGEDPAQVLKLVRSAAEAARSQRPHGAVDRRLLRQIHMQMHDTEEAERMLLQRPPELVQWSRINGPAPPYTFAVMAVRDRLVPAGNNTRFDGPAARSLVNVLHQLRHEEASEEYGAWLFARVVHDGRMLHYERAYDSWPSWYQLRRGAGGPTMSDLAWEMDQRTAQWRPAWARLLPQRD